jgi:hypothetical protein
MTDKILWVHIGGSNRKAEKQFKAFAQAGIELHDCGGTGVGHWSNRNCIMPDRPEARALLKKFGGTIRRDQGIQKGQMERML